MNNVRVEQFKGKNGQPVKNQFLLFADDGQYFQSYRTIIARKKWFHGGDKPTCEITLDRNSWDYSVTTGRYRNIFLGETKKETERKIKEGIYKLENLN